MKILICILLIVLVSISAVYAKEYNEGIYEQYPVYTGEQGAIYPADLRMRMNGDFIYISEDDRQAIIIGDYLLLPLRVIAEKLGFEVEWLEDTQTAFLSKDGHLIYVQVGSYFIVGRLDLEYGLHQHWHDYYLIISTPAQILNSRTMLPYSYFADIFNIQSEWDKVNYTIDLLHMPPAFNFLRWPSNSGEVTLWFGPFFCETLYVVESDSLNIQGGINSNVFSVADAVVAQIEEDRVFIDFSFGGVYMQIIYGNIIPCSSLNIGGQIPRGHIIGKKREHMNRGVLELKALQFTEDGTAVIIDPAPLFNLSILDPFHLYHAPMASFFEQNACRQGIMLTQYDRYFVRNRGLNPGELYLNRLLEFQFHVNGLPAQGYTFWDIFHRDRETETITITMLGETYVYVYAPKNFEGGFNS